MFAINNHVFRRKENQIRELEAQIDEIKKEWHEVASRFPDHVPEDKKICRHSIICSKRKEVILWNAGKTAGFCMEAGNSEKQQSAHKDWAEEGKLLKEAQAAVLDEWYKWLEANKLPKVLPEKVSELQEQWNKIYAEEGRGKIIDVRIDGAQENWRALQNVQGPSFGLQECHVPLHRKASLIFMKKIRSAIWSGGPFQKRTASMMNMSGK